MATASSDLMGPPPLPSTTEQANLPNQRSSKRLSLQFQLPNADHTRSRPSSIVSVSPASARPLSTESNSPVDNDPNAFLTTLAAQERRVMELKEELSKAESDLSRLKTQWAVHEATKKRSEIHKVEPLREMVSPARSNIGPGMLQRSRTSLEDDRNRPKYFRSKQSQMKTFSGGRHTRALSLLSPTTVSSPAGSITQPRMIDILPIQPPPKTTSPTLFSVEGRGTNYSQTQNINRDIMHTGKELVGGIREGLWTFIEDLKQATVGDEAVSGARAKQSMVTNRSLQTKRRNPGDKSPNLSGRVKDHVLDVGLTKSRQQSEACEAQSQKSPSSERTISKDPMIDEEDDDGWDNWDSPPPKTSSSSFRTTAGSTPRTSVSSTGSTDNTESKLAEKTLKDPKTSSEQIPWPALTKFRPSNLTRTASQLMAEWERSLTPPPEERGITSPATLASTQKENKAD